MKKRLIIVFALVAMVAGAVVYGCFDPATVRFPRCPFYVLTGLKCPGCGSQRAIHQLLHLHVGEALSYNALFVGIVPVVAFLLFAELFWRRFPRLHRAAANPVFSWTLVALILLWWLLRNVFGW